MAVGPISVHTISDDVPERKDYDVTLTFKLSTFGDSLDCPALTRMLHEVLRDWRDGRYPFMAEMVQHGLSECLKRALYEVVAEEAKKEFGHEMVPHSNGRGHTARWALEADSRFADMEKPWLNSEPEVRIVRRDP
jgi:hypothetical protein